MTSRYKTSALILSLAALQCGSTAPPLQVVIPNSCSQLSYPGGTVVGCNLAPRVAVLGVDEQAIYTVDGTRTFSAISQKTGQQTKLYHSLLFNYPMAEGASQLFSAGFAGGKIYFLDETFQDGRAYGGVMSLDPKDPHTPGSPSLVVSMDAINAGGLIIADGYVYFQDRSVPSGTIKPLVRVSLGGGPSQLVYAGEGDPIAVYGGYLYFRDVYGAIRRAPITGGAGNQILAKLPPRPGPSGTTIDYRDLAIDDSYLYVPVPSLVPRAPDTVQRYAVTGGDSGTIIASFSREGEVILGPPTSLRVDGDYLYFVLANGLNRLKRGGDGHMEGVIWAKSPPVFDATSIYVAQQLGGDDSPLQGIVVQVAK